MIIVQPFWPSIVVKKWLNIKPKVYDFSEDEVDTESEDDGMDPTNYKFITMTYSFLALSVLDQFLFCIYPACSLKDERLDVDEDHAHRIHGNQSVCASQTPGNT